MDREQVAIKLSRVVANAGRIIDGLLVNDDDESLDLLIEALTELNKDIDEALYEMKKS